MSYILDALKKADAQRERDPARGIHAQPAALAPARRVTGGPSSWLWAGAAAVVVVVAGIGWYVAQDRPVAPAAPAVAAHADAVPAPAVATVAAPPVVAQAAVPAPPPAPATVVLPPPEPARVAPREEADGDSARAMRRHRATTRAAVAAAPAPSAAASNARASGVAASAAPAKPGAAPTSAAEAAPITNGWPADAPKLAIGGGVYSPNRAQRMLIVNDQVVKEGADLGAGVVLEEIKAKSAVLRFRGSRYSVGF